MRYVRILFVVALLVGGLGCSLLQIPAEMEKLKLANEDYELTLVSLRQDLASGEKTADEVKLEEIAATATRNAIIDEAVVKSAEAIEQAKEEFKAGAMTTEQVAGTGGLISVAAMVALNLWRNSTRKKALANGVPT